MNRDYWHGRIAWSVFFSAVLAENNTLCMDSEEDRRRLAFALSKAIMSSATFPMPKGGAR